MPWFYSFNSFFIHSSVLSTMIAHFSQKKSFNFVRSLWLYQGGLRVSSSKTHRSLNIWKSICSLWEEIFVQDWASFQSVPVTRPVVTDVTARYRMKGMDITSPLIPRLVFFGLSCLQPLKGKHFFKKLKMLKFDQLGSAEKLNFLDTFFQMAAIPKEIVILTWNQSQMKLKTPNFHGKKEACWFVEPLLRYQSLKSGLILYAQKPRWISMSV